MIDDLKQYLYDETIGQSYQGLLGGLPGHPSNLSSPAHSIFTLSLIQKSLSQGLFVVFIDNSVYFAVSLITFDHPFGCWINYFYYLLYTYSSQSTLFFLLEILIMILHTNMNKKKDSVRLTCFSNSSPYSRL